MLSSRVIRNFWSSRLVSLGKSFDIKEIKDTKICFACGLKSVTEKAHIISKTQNGSDEALNLHLLCPTCHKDSELLTDENYLRWFVSRNSFEKLLSLYLKFGGSLSSILSSSDNKEVSLNDIKNFLFENQSKILEKEIRTSTSIRTIEALQSKKARGEKLGTPNPENLVRGRKIQAEKQIAEAKDFYKNQVKRILQLKKKGLSFLDIARSLNEFGLRTRQGREFQPITVKRIIDREKSGQ